MRTAPFRWGKVIDRSPFDEDFDSAGRRSEARICSRPPRIFASRTSATPDSYLALAIGLRSPNSLKDFPLVTGTHRMAPSF